MKLKHLQKRAIKNSLFRVVNEVDEKMYPLGLKEEVKYIGELDTALNRKYSKVEIANLLRRIMSYVIITNYPITATISQARKIVKSISKKEMTIICNYIIVNNQYIAHLNNAKTKKNLEKYTNNHLPFSQIRY